MDSKDFKQANVTLGAGNNPNTRPLRIALCSNAQMPDYKQGFLVSKWEMGPEEKYFYKQKLLAVLAEGHGNIKWTLFPEELADKIIETLPPVFLSCMHSMSPVMVLQYPESWIFDGTFLNPDQDAADKVNSKRVSDN